MAFRSLALAVPIAAIAAAAAAQQTATPGSQDVRQEVEAFVAKYVDTYNRKDAAGLASLYTQDGVLIRPGPMATGRENIEKAWKGVLDAGWTGLHYETREVHPEGNVVWSIGQFTVSSPEQDGTMQEHRGNFMNIYQREGGSLKFRVHAFNLIPAQTASAGTAAPQATGTASAGGR